MEPRFAMRTEPSLAQRIGQRVNYILWHSGYDILEMAIALPLFLLSVQLANPLTSSFAANPVSFRAVAATAPEVVWGAVGIALSVAEVLASIFERPILRVVVPGAMFLYLLFFGVLIGMANPFGTGVATYIGLAIWAVVIAIRAGRDLA